MTIVRPWPELDDAAYYGLVGEVVDTVLPNTEADPAALILDFLCIFGVLAGDAIGPWPHVMADAAMHPARLDVLIVGDTARARKSTAYLQVRHLFQYVDPEFFATQTPNGFGSGEAVIDLVAASPDKRLLLVEHEFSRVLTVAQREGTILSSVIRQCWDGDRLSVRTRSKAVTADQPANLAVIGHITAEELIAKSMNGTEAANGFLNRFLHVLVRRSKVLPSGGRPDENDLRRLARKINLRLKEASEVQEVVRSDQAEIRWDRTYRQLVEDDPGGILGAVIARSEAQVLRLSVAYALTDGSAVIRTHHIRAAKALWDYCRASAAYIYGRGPRADLVLDAVLTAGRKGITKTQLHGLLGRHSSKSELDRIIAGLKKEGLIDLVFTETGGRPAQRVIATNPAR